MMTMHDNKADDWGDTDDNDNAQRQGWGLAGQMVATTTTMALPPTCINAHADCHFTTNTYHYM